MKIHTVVITHNRLHLTKQVISSYLETVTIPHSLWVVDNASEDGTREWLMEEYDYGFSLLNTNSYPGYACNLGWSLAPSDATLLHRADNDFAFRPGWDEQVVNAFESPLLGQLGLRTDMEEVEPDGKPVASNVGGCCVIRRSLWDAGLRYDERPWPELREKVGIGVTEDSFFTPQIERMGFTWRRVRQPALISLATGDWADPYYQESYGIRGITPRAGDPTVPSGFVPKVF